MILSKQINRGNLVGTYLSKILGQTMGLMRWDSSEILTDQVRSLFKTKPNRHLKTRPIRNSALWSLPVGCKQKCLSSMRPTSTHRFMEKAYIRILGTRASIFLLKLSQLCFMRMNLDWQACTLFLRKRARICTKSLRFTQLSTR